MIIQDFTSFVYVIYKLYSEFLDGDEIILKRQKARTPASICHTYAKCKLCPSPFKCTTHLPQDTPLTIYLVPEP